MKLKDAYYRQNGYINTNCTQNAWLKNKDKFWRWVTNAYLKRVFGIRIKPKHRHRRSMRYNDMMALIGDNDNYKFAREAKPIGRRKHGKWLYTPKRVRLE